MLPTLRVHPVHFQHGVISSITWCGRAASTCTISSVRADEDPLVVWSARSCLKITSLDEQAESCIEVDMLLADVKCDTDPCLDQPVIIVSPWCEPQQRAVQFGDINFDLLSSHADMAGEVDEMLPKPDVCQCGDDINEALEFWVFLVEGNDSAVQATLGRMGEEGAVRWNPFAVLEVGRKIGSGANAIVYRAKHCHAEYHKVAGCTNPIVLKVLNPIPKCATALEELDMIQHEITLMVAAGRHPNLVKFLGLFCLEVKDNSVNSDVTKLQSSFSTSCLNPRWALVSEYLQGGDVFDAVAKRRFKEPRAKQVMADLFSALTHIHRRGIVHRDVKAENLLLAKDGKAVLSDFGIAGLISDDEEMHKPCGSPGYAAPELLRHKCYGIKVDSFSAGATLYFMLCGRLPFEGGNASAVYKRTLRNEVSFDNNPEFSKVSSQGKQFILKLLQKDPHHRPTAEQAASWMWCCSDETEWTSQPERGRSSMDTHTISAMPEAMFGDQFMHCNDQTHGSSSSTSGFPNGNREAGHPQEEDQNTWEDRDSTDPYWPRGSFRGWSQRLNRLMSKMKTNKADSQAAQSSTLDMGKGKSERSGFRSLEKDALHGGASAAEEGRQLPVVNDDSFAQPHSNAHGGLRSHMMRGQAGRLLQALNSTNATQPPETQKGAQSSQLTSGSSLKVVPPASRAEHLRPQSKSLWGRLSGGRSRKDEAPREENGDDSNEGERSASSLSLGPMMKNDGQEPLFHPEHDSRKPSSPKVLRPATGARFRYRNLVKAREPSAVSQAQATE